MEHNEQESVAVIKVAGYGEAEVIARRKVVDIITPEGETVSLYPHESKALRKALKAAERKAR